MKTWGGSGITFIIFILLARLLTPGELGLASAAGLVLLFISMFYEFGFGDAIIQRKNLQSEDINLPFYFSWRHQLSLLPSLRCSRSISPGGFI